MSGKYVEENSCVPSILCMTPTRLSDSIGLLKRGLRRKDDRSPEERARVGKMQDVISAIRLDTLKEIILS